MKLIDIMVSDHELALLRAIIDRSFSADVYPSATGLGGAVHKASEIEHE